MPSTMPSIDIPGGIPLQHQEILLRAAMQYQQMLMDFEMKKALLKSQQPDWGTSLTTGIMGGAQDYMKYLFGKWQAADTAERTHAAKMDELGFTRGTELEKLKETGLQSRMTDEAKTKRMSDMLTSGVSDYQKNMTYPGYPPTSDVGQGWQDDIGSPTTLYRQPYETLSRMDPGSVSNLYQGGDIKGKDLLSSLTPPDPVDVMGKEAIRQSNISKAWLDRAQADFQAANAPNAEAKAYWAAKAEEADAKIRGIQLEASRRIYEAGGIENFRRLLPGRGTSAGEGQPTIEKSLREEATHQANLSGFSPGTPEWRKVYWDTYKKESPELRASVPRETEKESQKVYYTTDPITGAKVPKPYLGTIEKSRTGPVLSPTAPSSSSSEVVPHEISTAIEKKFLEHKQDVGAAVQDMKNILEKGLKTGTITPERYREFARAIKLMFGVDLSTVK